MANNIFTTMNIAGQGMSVQRKRLSSVANNIANANTTKSIDGLPYRREIVVSRYVGADDFNEALESSLKLARTVDTHAPNARMYPEDKNRSVVKGEVTQDAAAERLVV